MTTDNATVERRDLSIDLGAERSVLGILLRNIEFLDVAAKLRPSCFYGRFHQSVYEAICDLSAESGAVDPLTVYDLLRKRGQQKGVGDPRGYLFDLVEAAGNPYHLAEHVAIVQEKSLIRRLREASQKAVQLTTNQRSGLTAAEMQEAVSDLFAPITESLVVNEPVPLNGKFGALMEFVEHLDRVTSGEVNPDVVATGLKELDEFLNGGLHLGNTYVIGARPSMGKTALALSILLNMARNGVTVGILSLEMPKVELTARLIANAGNMDFKPLASGKLETPDWEAVTSGLGILERCELYMDDEGTATLHDVEAKARSMMRQSGGKLKVLVIDYLQLMSGSNSNRTQMLGEVSRGLKRLAKKLKIAIVELSQLNRNIDHRADKRPVLADLRESGDIEADADVVIMPYRQVKDNPNCDYPDLVDVYITKQRNGRTGWMPLQFVGRSMKFVDWSGPAVQELDQRKRVGGGGGSRSRFDD